MICWAFSGLSQKFGCPMRALSCSRRDCLLEMSKRVPQPGQTVQDLVTTAFQFSVHHAPHRIIICALPAGINKTIIPKSRFARQFGFTSLQTHELFLPSVRKRGDKRTKG